jgi:hypothetical protein
VYQARRGTRRTPIVSAATVFIRCINGNGGHVHRQRLAVCQSLSSGMSVMLLTAVSGRRWPAGPSAARRRLGRANSQGVHTLAVERAPAAPNVCGGRRRHGSRKRASAAQAAHYDPRSAGGSGRDPMLAADAGRRPQLCHAPSRIEFQEAETVDGHPPPSVRRPKPHTGSDGCVSFQLLQCVALVQTLVQTLVSPWFRR